MTSLRWFHDFSISQTEPRSSFFRFGLDDLLKHGWRIIMETVIKTCFEPGTVRIHPLRPVWAQVV
jgi:hypothetical protein